MNNTYVHCTYICVATYIRSLMGNNVCMKIYATKIVYTFRKNETGAGVPLAHQELERNFKCGLIKFKHNYIATVYSATI